MRPRALILDFGGVLVHDQDPDAVARMAAVISRPVEIFTGTYWNHRPMYDGGSTAADYWRVVLEALHVDNPDPLIESLIALDIQSWTRYREEVWDLAARFRAAGGRTSMLSNGVPEIMGVVRRERRLEDWFDDVVVSYEVGCQKPDASIYRLALSRLGVRAPDALFVDDLARNIDAAEAVGLQTLLFAGDSGVTPLKKLLESDVDE